MIQTTPKMMRPVAMLLCVAVAALAGACGSTPEVVHYRLQLEPTPAQSTPDHKVVLGLEQFTVDAAYDENKIVYRSSAYQLNYYFYHRWAAMPGLLVTDSLRRGYSQSGHFDSVTSGQVARSDIVLSGHVAAIEEVNLSDQEWVGRVVLELRLRDMATGTALWNEVVEEQVALEERTPAGLANGISKALTRIVDHTAPRFAQMGLQARQSRKLR